MLFTWENETRRTKRVTGSRWMGIFGIRVCIDGEVSSQGGSIAIPTCCEVEKVRSILESEPPALPLWRGSMSTSRFFVGPVGAPLGAGPRRGEPSCPELSLDSAASPN